MDLLFSPTTKHFYSPKLGGIPKDATISVTFAERRALRDQCERENKIIDADENGYPIAVEPPPAPEPPAPTEQELAEQRISEIQQALTANDLASVRPLRAIFDAQKKAVAPDPQDEARLTELEEQAQTLRAELATLAAQLNTDAT
ncbi:hypothetical protein [Halodesulfovibrio aestuarii]|uniref:Uncharacterized protein n=1 Tax=Halodesulfovibrio aestuarii TaxID=126333 RepID=A0ABV4JUN5_9BACT